MRLLKIVSTGALTLLLIAGTAIGYLALSPWRGKVAFSLFILCGVIPYLFASGLLVRSEPDMPKDAGSGMMAGYAASDVRSSNVTRRVMAMAFAVLVMAFCLFFPMIPERYFR